MVSVHPAFLIQPQVAELVGVDLTVSGVVVRSGVVRAPPVMK